MTEEEKDILILKILEHPQSLTDDEVTLILSDRELLDIYNTSLKVKDAVRPPLKVDPSNEWELMKARMQVASKEDGISSTPGSELQSEEDRKSFFAIFLRSISKRPVAAAVGTVILAGALAAGLLWNLNHNQQEDDSNLIAQNSPNRNNSNIEIVKESDSSDGVDNNLVVEQMDDNQKIIPIQEDRTSTPVKNQSDFLNKGLKVQNSTSNSVNSSSEIEESKIPSSPVNQNTELQVTANDPNNPNAQNLAIVEEDVNEYQFGKLDGLWPEDWDIDECVRLQQARLDNQIAMVVAESQRREFEVYRQNLLIEYELSNPNSDGTALMEYETYINQKLGDKFTVVQ